MLKDIFCFIYHYVLFKNETQAYKIFINITNCYMTVLIVQKLLYTSFSHYDVTILKLLFSFIYFLCLLIIYLGLIYYIKTDNLEKAFCLLPPLWLSAANLKELQESSLFTVL